MTTESLDGDLKTHGLASVGFATWKRGEEGK